MQIKGKKEVFSIVLYVLIIFFIGIGLTFSYFSLVSSAPKDSTKIYAGRLDINFIEGNEVSIDVLTPIAEPSFNTTRSVYRNRFGVSSNGTLEQSVAIDFKVNKTEFSDNNIKYAIYSSSGKKLATGYLNNGTTRLVENLYFKPVDMQEFVLLIWLDEKNYSQNLEQDKILSGTIIINSTQLKS